MSKPFEEIPEAGFDLLEQILKQPGAFPSDFWIDEPTVDGQLELLLKSNLAVLNDENQLSITELGRAALKHHDHVMEQNEIIQKQHSEELELFKIMSNSMQQQLAILSSQNDSTQIIADSACRQAESASNQAKSADELAKTTSESSKSSTRYARISTVLSVIAIIISIIAIIMQQFGS